MSDQEFIEWHLERAINELHNVHGSFPHMKSGVHLSHAKGVLETLFEQREWEEAVNPFIVGLIGNAMSHLSRAENLLRNDDGDEQEAVFRATMCIGRSIERLEIARDRLE